MTNIRMAVIAAALFIGPLSMTAGADAVAPSLAAIETNWQTVAASCYKMGIVSQQFIDEGMSPDNPILIKAQKICFINGENK